MVLTPSARSAAAKARMVCDLEEGAATRPVIVVGSITTFIGVVYHNRQDGASCIDRLVPNDIEFVRYSGDIAQLARATALQAVGLGFESPYLHEVRDEWRVRIRRVRNR